MKIIHIHAKSLEEIKIKNPETLPTRIGLVTTIQHMHKLEEVKTFLEKKGKKAVICGQVLGCNASCTAGKDVDAFLYIGSGRFHPIGVALKTLKD